MTLEQALRAAILPPDPNRSGAPIGTLQNVGIDRTHEGWQVMVQFFGVPTWNVAKGPDVAACLHDALVAPHFRLDRNTHAVIDETAAPGGAFD